MTWHRGCWNSEWQFLVFRYDCLGIDQRISFESTNDFRAGLEEKDMFSRHHQAREYAKKAEEAHRMIVVRNAAWFVYDEILSLFCCPAATYYGPVIAGFGYF